MSSPASLIPCLSYEDAPAAIDFLCRAFGFQRHAVFTDDKNPAIVQHAQLTLGNGMIMLSSVAPSPFAKEAPMTTVAKAGGNTQSPYIIVEDVDTHAAVARAAGADIFIEPRDEDYGGRGYAARDPEGNAWSFGSYDPWATAS